MSGFGYLLVLLGLCCASVLTGTYNLTRHLSIEWELFQNPSDSDEASIRMTVRKTRKGWAAFGFGKTMFAAEILQFERISPTSNAMNVTNCYLSGYDAPVCGDMTQGWKTERNQATPEGFEVVLTRSLIKRDLENGQNVFPKGNYILYAYTDSDIVEVHYDKEGAGFGQLNLDFTTGAVFTENGLKWGFIRHEYYQFFIWTVFADSLILLGRYFKWVANYQDIHSIVFTALIFLSYQATYTDQVNMASKDPEAWAQHGNNIHIHAHYSDFLVPIVGSQILIGLAVRLAGIFRSVPVKVKRWVRYLHMAIGMVTWLLARFVVVFGTYLFWRKHENIFLLLGGLLETALFIGSAVFLQSQVNSEVPWGEIDPPKESLVDGEQISDWEQNNSQGKSKLQQNHVY